MAATVRRPRSFSLKVRSWIPVLALGAALASCDDPEKAARLKWREDEVNAREANLVEREERLAQETRRVDDLDASIHQRERQIQVLHEQLTAEIEKTKRVRRELEIRQLRGPIPKITAGRAIIVDPKSRDILWEHNADKVGPIASTQKLLTALLVIESGDLDKIVTIELSDTQCAPVRIGLKPGEQYTRRQLLTALLVKSSNDIAQALARDSAGSVEAFVGKMNDRAAQLGLQHSFFVNPHGLPSDPPQFSTARDLSLIACAVDVIPEIRQMVSLKSFKFEKPDKQAIVLENTNRVLKGYSYCDGMKTGFTSESGYCLVASGEKNGVRRIVVVLNGTSSGVWRDAQSLLEWALKA